MKIVFLWVNNELEGICSPSFPYPLVLLTSKSFASSGLYLSEPSQKQTHTSQGCKVFLLATTWVTLKTFPPSWTSCSFVLLLVLTSKSNLHLNYRKKGSRCEDLSSYQSVAIPVHASFGSWLQPHCTWLSFIIPEIDLIFWIISQM